MLITIKELARKLNISETYTRVVADRFNIKRVRKCKFAFFDIQNYEIKKMKDFIERKTNGNKGRNTRVCEQNNDYKQIFVLYDQTWHPRKKN